MGRYRFVPEHSFVVIDAQSNVHPIHTRADGLTGALDVVLGDHGDVDVTAALTGTVSFAVERLSSGNPLQDRELRRRIDARRFPRIDGQLDALVATDEPGRYHARGAVSFRGVTCDVEDALTITLLDDGALRIEGFHDFDIRDFGMAPPHILLMRVEPVVRVRIDVVAVAR